MRVLLVSYHFPPSDQVGARRAGRIVDHLVRQGHSVDVLCAALDDGIGSRDPSEADSVPPGATVTRIRIPFRFSRNPFRVPAGLRGRLWWKFRAYLERLLLTKDWSFRWGLKAVTYARETENCYDLVVAEGPPNPAVVPVLRVAQEWGLPSLLDLRDMWPSSTSRWPRMLSPGINPLPGPRREAWNLDLKHEALLTATRIVVTTQEIADLLSSEVGKIESRKPCIAVVPNAYSAPDADEQKRPLSPAQQDLKLVYTGSLAYGRDVQLLKLVRAMAAIRSQANVNCELAVVGPIRQGFVHALEEFGYTGFVTVHDAVGRLEAIEFQRGADALVLLQPGDKPWTRAAVPAKLFEYMERRRNIIAIVPPGPAAKIVRDHGLGCVVTSSDDLTDALWWLFERVRSDRQLPLPPKEFSAESTMTTFVTILEETAGTGRC